MRRTCRNYLPQIAAPLAEALMLAWVWSGIFGISFLQGWAVEFIRRSLIPERPNR